MRRLTGSMVVGCAGLLVGFWGCSGSGDDTAATGAGGATSATVGTQTVAVTVVGPASTSSGGPVDTKLAAACAADADCGAGFRCITAKSDSPSLNGGAANGYCTKDCFKDSDCPGEGSTCLIAKGMDQGECFLGCGIGPELMYVDDPIPAEKCHGRDDLRCSQLNAGTVCVPQCGKDSQCDGRQCDPRTGFCVDKASTGKPMGAACDPDAPVNECAGFCQKFTGTSASVCTSPCTLGDSDLANTNDCGGLDKGLCVFRPSGYGAGDFGRCSRACTEHGQCANPHWWCNGNNFASNGYCFTTTDCKTTADCAASGAGYACTETKFGGKCLELDPACVKNGGDEKTCGLRFPLGDAAPSSTSGTSGTGGMSGAGGAM